MGIYPRRLRHPVDLPSKKWLSALYFVPAKTIMLHRSPVTEAIAFFVDALLPVVLVVVLERVLEDLLVNEDECLKLSS